LNPLPCLPPQVHAVSFLCRGDVLLPLRSGWRLDAASGSYMHAPLLQHVEPPVAALLELDRLAAGQVGWRLAPCMHESTNMVHAWLQHCSILPFVTCSLPSCHTPAPGATTRQQQQQQQPWIALDRSPHTRS
jgi:hypothetical protein